MKEDSIAHLVDSLSGGLIDNDRRRAYSSYNMLFRIGAEAIPLLEKRLLDQSWDHLRYPYLSRYAVGIIALIRDIDEDRGDAAIERLIHNGCDEGLKRAIHSVQEFSASSFVRYRLYDVDILEEKGLTTTISIRSLLEVWLANIPRKDLDHLVRILVVHPKRLHESAGNYTPFLAKIELAWPALLKKRSVFSSLVSLTLVQIRS